ncbi:hypothetical protein Egran_01054 [Elaphomyces granulatus]|uniref:Thioesterase domain-containing protein n=1 Tax=Elaphomyces granulatus TaxID=519963 RepID=A0A232M441_9EURO|nr:hypothetical protein Egran_01054 [Elaphomyces granulatus]
MLSLQFPVSRAMTGIIFTPTKARLVTLLPARPSLSQIAYRSYRRRLYSTESAGTSQPERSKLRSRLFRALGFTSIAVVAFLVGFAYSPAKALVRIMTVSVPTDEETLSLFKPQDEFAREVDTYIRTHPVAEALRANPAFVESRPHLKIPEGLRSRTLIAGTLAGSNKIVVPPYSWSEKAGKSTVSIYYLGSDISGHPDIVHGGLLATILDEGMGICCFGALPSGFGVTANLNIDYKRPVPTNTYAVLKAETVKVAGRKAWVEGRIESLPEKGEEPVVFVEAKALFVEPKLASV